MSTYHGQGRSARTGSMRMEGMPLFATHRNRDTKRVVAGVVGSAGQWLIRRRGDESPAKGRSACTGTLAGEGWRGWVEIPTGREGPLLAARIVRSGPPQECAGAVFGNDEDTCYRRPV
jgi:hypothetical protein